MSRISLLLFCLMFAALACSSPLNSISPTATPERPLVREALHEGRPGDGALTVTLDEITLLEAGPTPDVQWIAVLADGLGNTSHLIYPANQPGLSDTTLELADYPLQIQTQAESATLWLLAVQHHAYPVADDLGMAEIGRRLAVAFDTLAGTPTVARVVAADGSETLLRWFGEIEVIDELTLTIDQAEATTTEIIETVESANAITRLTYHASYNPVEAIIAAPASTEIPVTDEAENLETAFPEYKLVINEDFANAQSSLKWFRGRDNETYFATIVEGAYRIGLIGVDEFRDNPLSWGSIQELVFDDYIVRARMRVIEQDVTARYGLWLHYQDDWNFVFFGVENTGRYRIAVFKNTYTELQNWTVDASVNRSSNINEMEVHIQGDAYTMFVNGVELTTVNNSTYDTGRIAFFCYAQSFPATCDLQSIQVWIPEDEPFPPATPTATP